MKLIFAFLFVHFRVINLENGLTALLISDTHSVTHHTHHGNEMSTADEDEDTCSEDFEEESDDEGDDDDNDNDNDNTDGVIGGDPKGEQDNGAERSRKSKDTKLVSTCFCCDFKHVVLWSRWPYWRSETIE